MPSQTSVRSFFPGKRSSGHMSVDSTPYKRVSGSPSDSATASTVQASGQFGRPAGQTKASPLSSKNGVAKGVGGVGMGSGSPDISVGPNGMMRGQRRRGR
jgi:hypothetical protein